MTHELRHLTISWAIQYLAGHVAILAVLDIDKYTVDRLDAQGQDMDDAMRCLVRRIGEHQRTEAA